MNTSMLLAALVLSMGAASAVAGQSALDGKTIFEQSCRACHGASGVPSPAMVKMMGVPTLSAAYFAAHDDDAVVLVVKKGQGKMKPMADKLTPDQMVMVEKYVRQLVAQPAK